MEILAIVFGNLVDGWTIGFTAKIIYTMIAINNEILLFLKKY